jgi:hypothetical protein
MSDLTDRLRGLYVANGTNYVQEAADEIERLRAELAKHQDSEFHPDWSMLAATRESLREHQQMIVALREQLALAESVRAAQVAGLTEGAEKLREDAARYRKWRADYTGEGPYTLLSALADAWEPAQVDAAIDAALKGET